MKLLAIQGEALRVALGGWAGGRVGGRLAPEDMAFVFALSPLPHRFFNNRCMIKIWGGEGGKEVGLITIAKG